MSIIHDALKKVQSKGPNTAPDAVPPKEDPAGTITTNPATGRSPDTTKVTLSILMATVLTIAVIVIFAVILKLGFETTQHPAIKARAITPVPTQTTAAPVPPPSIAQAANTALPAMPLRPPAEPPAPDRTRVEGVMDMGGKMVALINGNVYEEGQVVDGNIIAAITFESVTIMENGTKKILPIKR